MFQQESKQKFSKILNYDFSDVFDEETVHYAQIVYLSSDSFNINRLIKDYSLYPELVLETILLLFDNPEYRPDSLFPYDAFIPLIDSGNFDGIQLISHLSECRHVFYVNMLYRIGFRTNETINKFLSNISVLLGIKSCWKVFEDRNIWGLSRPRAGFFTKDDLEVLSLIKNGNYDIFSLFADRKMHLPLFLQSAFSLITGFEDDISLSDSDLLQFRNVIDQIYEMIFPILSNPVIKTNFCDLIVNVYSQDRIKLKFDENVNCSDSFCYTLAIVLIKISKGIFNPTFIHKINENKFPTFCFFYICRMLEISLFRLVGNLHESYNEKNSALLILSFEETVQEYLNFVYNLIDERKREVFKMFIDHPEKIPEVTAINNSTEDKNTSSDVVDITLEDKKASIVSEIMYDSSFINTIVTLQSSLTCKRISIHVMTLINIIFAYKNTFKGPSIRILRYCKFEISPILIRRLTIHYLNKTDENIYSDRILIHEILQKYELEPTKDSLRMIGFALGSFEEKLSSIFDSITKINLYKEKERALKGLEEECELSEDEETINVIPTSMLERISTLPRPLFIDFVRRMLDVNDLNTPRGREALEEIEFQVKNRNDPFKMKLFKKIKVNSFRMKRNGDILKYSAVYLEELLRFLKNSTNINKRLFLNKIIFFRLFSIANSALDLLVGEQSLKVRLQNKEEFKFYPREILRLVLLIILNILKDNIKLIEASGLNRTMFQKAIQIMEDRHVLMEEELTGLKKILNGLPSIKMEYVEEDIPEEFVDPLTFNMMNDPVILLTSKITIDRSTFNQIMLNDQIDPFSRMPLDESKIKEDVELREKIEEYKKTLE